MENYYYVCTNKLCRNCNAMKNKYEKICPLCGTETMVYKIEYRPTQRERVPLKVKILVAALVVLLIISIMLNLYLVFL